MGLMLVPQCLAFALLAGLPIRAGLYSSFAPLVIYALLGALAKKNNTKFGGSDVDMILLKGGGYCEECHNAHRAFHGFLISG